MILGMEQETSQARGLAVTYEALRLIAEVGEFKGRWEALRALSPDRLRALRHVATIESIGSSTPIEDVRLTDREIESLLADPRRHTFKSRDEQEVVGYAEVMELVFQSWGQLAMTENHIRQLHSVLLEHSDKDQHHRGEYKKTLNHVIAYDPSGREIRVIFETATPFQTPFGMERLVEWTRQALEE